MTAVYIPFYRQRTLPNINEERSVQGQINQIIPMQLLLFHGSLHTRRIPKLMHRSIDGHNPNNRTYGNVCG